MTTADMGKLKEGYLEFIDLLRKCRIKETLGKRGSTSVPMAEIKKIDGGTKTSRYLTQLAMDKVIQCTDPDSVQETIIVAGNDPSEVCLDCLMTAEEILAYKNSLIIEGSLGIRVERVNNNYYELRRGGHPEAVRLTDHEGKLLTLLREKIGNVVPRSELRTVTGLVDGQISSTITSLRRKLEKIGFTHEQTKEMIPPYLREGITLLA